jgi:hypothetical protein
MKQKILHCVLNDKMGLDISLAGTSPLHNLVIQNAVKNLLRLQSIRLL